MPRRCQDAHAAHAAQQTPSSMQGLQNGVQRLKAGRCWASGAIRAADGVIG
jgi:hypothetical protein